MPLKSIENGGYWDPKNGVAPVRLVRTGLATIQLVTIRLVSDSTSDNSASDDSASALIELVARLG